MQTEEFLRRILPPLDDDGFYCWATPAPANSGRRFNQHFPKHIGQMVEGIRQLDEQRVNTYYAMASFVQRGSREHSNVARIKAFWLDIDCGAGKDYPSKQEGATALVAAVKALGLPAPMVVDSGNGLHVYWPLTEAVDADQWKPVALSLAAAFRAQSLLADYQCTIDQSRILRTPGSHNWKDPANPKLVKVVSDCPDYLLAQIASCVETYQVEVPVAVVLGGLNSDLDIHYESEPVDANVVANHCAQLAAMRDSRGMISEPVWRDCLGVIKHCIDPEAVAVKWSSGHPDFSERDTLAKLRARKAPTRCDTFERDNPSLCERCEYRGTVTSPIQLNTDDSLCGEVTTPELSAPAEGDTVTPVHDVVIKQAGEMAFNIPEIMAATYQWKNGRLLVAKGEGWTAFSKSMIVIDDTLEMGGESMARVRIQFPDGTVKQAMIAGGDILAKDSCLKALAKRGVTAINMKDSEMHVYLRKWFEQVQNSARAARTYDHFGWQNGDTFLLGNNMFHPDGSITRASIPTEMSSVANAMEPVGTIDGWKEIVNQFYGGDGMEQYLFIMGVGFAAPLMKLSQVNGVMFSALSESGFGKTACERIMLSMYGDPSQLLRSYKGTTINGLYDWIGMMGSLPVVVDEITTVKPEAIADIAYDISSGQSKMRLNREGKAREQRDPWHTIVQTSSNSSLWEKLAARGAVADAQWLRMLEFNMTRNFRLSPAEARDLMDELDHHHGAVGAAYIQYVVQNREECREMVRATMRRVESMAGVDATERFWSAGVACVVAGLVIARKCGLIECTPGAVLKWAVDQIKAGRRGLQSAAPGSYSLFKQMVTELSQQVLTTDKMSMPEDLDERFITQPRGDFVGRSIVTEQRAWFTESACRKWAARAGTGYQQMIEEARRMGAVDAIEDFALGEGTVYVTAPVRCIRVRLDCLK